MKNKVFGYGKTVKEIAAMLFGTRDPKLQDGPPPFPHDAPPNAVISPDTLRGDEKARIPVRQARTKKWPVLDAGGLSQPVPLDKWRFEMGGLVDAPVSWTWDEFQKLPRVKVFADMHCVTRWSRLGNVWEGVSTREVVKHLHIDPLVKFVLVTAYDKGFSFRGGAMPWTTNMPLDWFLGEDCLLADTHDGLPISLEHGGPLRLVIPRLYAWKSAKWVHGIEFRANDTPGFWERGGYHMLGDPWKEQRYGFAEGDEPENSI